MIDLIPKQAFAYPKRTTLFFYGGLFLLIAFVAGFLVLKVLQARTLADIASVEEQLSREKTTEELKLEQSLLKYERKLKDFSSLADNRVDVLPFLEFLEAQTHPALFFTNLTLDARERKLSLSGEALDFKTLDQQLALFKENAKVASVEVSGVAIGERGRAAFQFTLVFRENLFQ